MTIKDLLENERTINISPTEYILDGEKYIVSLEEQRLYVTITIDQTLAMLNRGANEA